MSVNTPQLGMPGMPQLGMPQLGMPGMPQLGMPQGLPQQMPAQVQGDFAESLSKTLSKTILDQATARIRDQLTSFANIVCSFPEATAKGITAQYILDLWNSVAPELAISTTAPVQAVAGVTCAAKLLKGKNANETCKNKPTAGSAYCSRHKNHAVPPMVGAPPQGVPGVVQGMPGMPPQGMPGMMPQGIVQLNVPAAHVAPVAPQAAAPQTCQVTLKSGARKDQQCGGKLVAGGTTCSRHAPKSAAPVVPQLGMPAAQPIGVPAANLPQYGIPQPIAMPSGIPMLAMPPPPHQ